MKNDLKQYVLAVTVLGIAFLAAVAYGQTQSLMLGNDYATDGGLMRRVRVDSLGRIVTTGGSSGGSGTTTDGGVAITVPGCSATKQATTQVNLTSLDTPADGGFPGHWYTRVCNSARNSGTPIITCTADGQTPTAASSSSGDALEVSDCVTYLTGATVRCISDTTATQVTTEECR